MLLAFLVGLFVLMGSVANGSEWLPGRGSRGTGHPPSSVSLFAGSAHHAAEGSAHHAAGGEEKVPFVIPDIRGAPVVASSAVLPNSLTFLAIGDWGRGGRGGQEETAPALGAWAAAVGAEFIVSVGDNVYVDGIPPGSAPSVVQATMKAFFSDVYKAPSLIKLPWYVIMGNHDYRGSVEPQLEWNGDERWHPGLYFAKQWPVPGPAAGAKSCLSIVFTDTTPLIKAYTVASYRKRLPILSANIDSATPAQTTAWTRQAVEAATAACDAVIVVGHHPLYSPGEHSNVPELIALYEPLLESAGVDAYIAGHDHILAHSRSPKGSVEHVLTGAGSEVRPELNGDGVSTEFVATVRGFTIHSVNATHIAHSYVWAGAADGKTAGETRPGLPGRIVHQVVKPLREKKKSA